jgi:hypothetical protein
MLEWMLTQKYFISLNFLNFHRNKEFRELKLTEQLYWLCANNGIILISSLRSYSAATATIFDIPITAVVLISKTTAIPGKAKM